MSKIDYVTFVSENEPGGCVLVPSKYLCEFISIDDYTDFINSANGREKAIAIRRSPAVIGITSTGTTITGLFAKHVRKGRLDYRELEDGQLVKTLANEEEDYLIKSSVAAAYLKINSRAFAKLKMDRHIGAYFVDNWPKGERFFFRRMVRTELFLLRDLHALAESI